MRVYGSQVMARWQLGLCVFVGLIAAVVVGQNRPNPALTSRAALNYPPLARQARIQGQVHLEFFVSPRGDVVAVNVLSGHPMLAPAASENVRSWKFATPKTFPADDQRYETIFDFEISEEILEVPADSNALVTFDTFRHVRIETAAVPIDNHHKSDCPSEEEKRPPSLNERTTSSRCRVRGVSGTVRSIRCGFNAMAS
jgi:TonB family protein